MKYRALMVIAAAAVVWLGCNGTGNAAEPKAKSSMSADSSARPKARYKRRRPLEVTIYPGRRIGGYSYGSQDVVNTYRTSPPPWMDVRQTPGGPFDSGFFFDSGVSPRGGNAPYLH